MTYRVGEEFGTKSEIGLFFFVSHGIDDLVVDRAVVCEVINNDGESRCEAAIGCDEFNLFDAFIYEESILSMNRMVVEVDATISKCLKPSLEDAVGFNIRWAQSVGCRDWGMVGKEYPGVNGKTFGTATMRGCLVRSVISNLILPGLAGSGISTALVGGSGPSSSRGLDVERASLNFSALTREGQMLVTSPRASLIRMLTGQMTSIALPRLPARMSSPVRSWVANGKRGEQA